MDLILWRHAEAQEGDNDLARQLTDKGHQQAHHSALWLAAHLPPHYHLWASAAVRSQQTAAYLRPTYETVTTLNPNAHAAILAKLLPKQAAHTTLVWVGHQPWIGQLCAWLLNGHWQAATYWSVKKSGFWWFEVLFDAHGCPQAKLKTVLTPSMLENNHFNHNSHLET